MPGDALAVIGENQEVPSRNIKLGLQLMKVFNTHNQDLKYQLKRYITKR